jgi:hypothetical protein
MFCNPVFFLTKFRHQRQYLWFVDYRATSKRLHLVKGGRAEQKRRLVVRGRASVKAVVRGRASVKASSKRKSLSEG